MTSEGHVVGSFVLAITLAFIKSSLGDNSANITCPSPPPLEHGGFTLETNMSATYTCDTGYRLSGSSSIQCENNRWQSLSATCIIIDQPFGRRCYAVNNEDACSTKNAVCIKPDDGQPMCSCRQLFAYNNTNDECYLKSPENVQCVIHHIGYADYTGKTNTIYWTKIDCSDDTQYERFIISAWNTVTGRVYRTRSMVCNETSFTRIYNMDPGYPFAISVDGGFDAFVSNEKRICSSGQNRPLAPHSLKFSLTEADSFQATWKYEYESSHVDGFSLGVEPGHLSFKIAGEDTSYVVEGLNASTRYSVSMAGLAGELESGSVTETVCTRPLPPTNVTLVDQAERHITVDIHPNVDRDNELRPGASIGSDPLICRRSRCIVRNLKPGYTYTITGYILSNCGGWSRPGGTVDIFTRPPRPRFLETIDNVTDSSLCVKWTKPSAGNYDGYVVKLLTSDTVVNLEKTYDTKHCVPNLSTGTKYKVDVKSIWRGKTSIASEIITVRTIPGPPTNMKGLDNATETTLCVQWEPPAVGGADKYKLQLFATARKVLEETADTMHCFGQLETDTKYTISIWTIWRDLTSVDHTTIVVNTQKDKQLEASLEYYQNIAMMQKEMMKKMEASLEYYQNAAMMDKEMMKKMEASLEYYQNAAMMDKKMMRKMNLVLQSVAECKTP